jgi:hypothetical protein
VRDRGTRFVKQQPDGTWETLYWRLTGVRDARAPGAGIEGWVAYDGDQIIGLNPNAPMYVTIQGVARPPAVITAVPAGYALNRCVVRDGYWLAGLERIANLKARPDPQAKIGTVERVVQTLRVRAAAPVQFLGTASVKPLANNEYEVQVALPGTFAAYWTDAAAVKAGPLPPPPIATAHDRLNGLVYHRYAKPKLTWGPVGEIPQQEMVMTWLVQLPPQPLQLKFQYGTTHGYGDGANYMVRVNGQEIWKEYRPQLSDDPAKAQAHEAPPIPTATVDLAAYAGQTIVLELADNGQDSGGSETISWGEPQLAAKP